MTTRWRLAVAYDGTDFSGWATQPGLRTVQGTLEEWIRQVLRLPDPVQVVCAGRTDAGVHARGQVIHVDLPTDAPVDTLERRLRRVLPPDVVIHDVRPAPAGFDARFAAIWRRYVYRLNDGAAPMDPLLRGHIVRARRPLDVDAMNDAAPLLIGLKDFAPFCRRHDGATTIRTLLELRAERDERGDIACTVRADAFCHSMVRSLMGAMTAIGTGKRDRAWLAEVMTSSGRHPEVEVMPARGLCLEEVGYPPEAELAARVVQARAKREVDEL
ncbi:tRNA pseudouridine(38-40) synthase TruA [Granulicoccus sp. GXG6511]|uniref:tRNA pseudouridine(38-40) synthase TruA n=1 Tax=Granulicoccus sp. GXG6511 TaxID=3381351 RepID=UPI003D7EDCEB